MAAAVAWLSTALLLLPAGRGCAGWLFGGGWAWPDRAGLRRSIGGVLTGRPAAGLSAVEAAQLPGPWAVYGAVVLLELLLLVGTVWAGTRWWHHLGPGAHGGMASRAEVGAVLGVRRLRRVRRVVRPDLYGAARRTSGRRRW